MGYEVILANKIQELTNTINRRFSKRQWEYKVYTRPLVYSGQELEDKLNEFAKEGWVIEKIEDVFIFLKREC